MNVARLCRLYFIVERSRQMTKQGRGAWRVYERRRLQKGLSSLDIPALMQERYKRSLWPYDRPRETMGQTLRRAPDEIHMEEA